MKIGIDFLKEISERKWQPKLWKVGGKVTDIMA